MCVCVHGKEEKKCNIVTDVFLIVLGQLWSSMDRGRRYARLWIQLKHLFFFIGNKKNIEYICLKVLLILL